LICVITGSTFIVALDLRKNSNTFGKYECFTLPTNDNAVYISELFALGVLSLEDSVVGYNCTDKYIPENCGGIIWNDAELNIPWPINPRPVLSEKDKNLQTFNVYIENRMMIASQDGKVQDYHRILHF
jgi:dTDP-4-dehydrorhamnose 3,5-epimerase